LDSSSVFFALPKTEKPRWNHIYKKFVRGVEENSWGCCFARFFPWGDLEREETGGGTGWQSGGNAGNPNFIDGLDEARRSWTVSIDRSWCD
jgi:hypothetical protein